MEGLSIEEARIKMESLIGEMETIQNLIDVLEESYKTVLTSPKDQDIVKKLLQRRKDAIKDVTREMQELFV